MKEKKTIDKINNYYRKFCIGITTISIYIAIILLKNIFYSLFGLNLKYLNNFENKLITITYQIFALTISINFYIKNRKETLEDFKEYLKKGKTALLTIIVYSLTTFLELIILYYMKVNVAQMEKISKTIYLISCETLILGILCLINRKTLEKNIKDIKINFKKYLDKYTKYYILAISVMLISNILINLIYPVIAGNQESVNNILTKYPVYMFFSSVIFAPIAEELVFRQSIRNIIKDNLTFIITSGLIFGGMHVIGNINNFYDLLYIIPYSAPGIAFAYILSKTDNILVSMLLHFLHNLIMTLAQIIIIFVL